ncbi:MAG: LysM peptidoglycan-binding domain-containing protein [Paracoccaceae bacterium]
MDNIIVRYVAAVVIGGCTALTLYFFNREAPVAMVQNTPVITTHVPTQEVVAVTPVEIEAAVPEVAPAAEEPEVAQTPVEDTSVVADEPAEDTPDGVADAPDTEETPAETPVEIPVEDVAALPTELPAETTVLETPDPEVTETAEGTDITEESSQPTFDIVRVDESGMAVIAGTAEPNSTVSILSDGVEIGETLTSNSGEFVAIVNAPDPSEAQNIELQSELDGELQFSDESILILPSLNPASAEVSDEEIALPTIIKTTPDEVVVVQPGGQLILDQISLDSISYDEEGEVLLAGRGTPGREVIIYVSGTPIKQTEISQIGSWKAVLMELTAGKYTLRIDEIDAVGKVTSRIEMPFQRAYPADVSAAQQSAGSQNDTYIVQQGNSLWLIATSSYGEGDKYYQILAANKDKIRDPDLIYPGQVFAIPKEE